MDHPFVQLADPGSDRAELLAAMLEVDLTASHLRVAVAKADLQVRSTSCIMLPDAAVERLLSRSARAEQRHEFEELSSSVRRYVAVLSSAGSSRVEVTALVRETVAQVTMPGAWGSTTIRNEALHALELCYDASTA